MADVSDLERAVRERGREIRDGAAFALEADLRDGAPEKTGELRRSIAVDPFDRGDVVGCTAHVDVEYAEFVEDGTRPHTILPRFAKALRFEVGGAVVFARRVEHPGTRPTHFFSDKTKRWDEYLQAAQ